MTYELAKKLKDAGFPLVKIREVFAISNETEAETGIMHATQTPDLPKSVDGWLVPTLSELIEACGEKFRKVHQNGKGLPIEKRWGASGDGIITHWVYGSTPDEAVANLWLKINEENN